ncbi:unnamed protein product [Eruca vesicaria subsp. sativa]|uniref:Uncharacterized protein n=1 Tax=Eruca vesicaria subsp. sativa TaxID=29727 RepID=A0ABC8KY91_ERUVS|nr:unnamed protein product [Eruca vesicaria subsp. sativa]
MTSSGTAASLLLALVIVVTTADCYVTPAPTTFTSPFKTPCLPKPNTEIAIEGLILCKSGNETYPIKGAKVIVVCPIVDSYGKLVAKVIISSYPTDLKGYFYFIMYGLSHKVKNINGCKVMLESSPVSMCKTRTNVNKGVTGAPLSSDSSKFLSRDNLNLYTLEPFYFSSPVAPKPVH